MDRSSDGDDAACYCERGAEVEVEGPSGVLLGEFEEVAADEVAVFAGDVLEVAIADGDGNLSVGESALVFGYDCGRWFRRETKDDAVRPAASGKLTLHRDRDGFDPNWNLAKVTRRGLRPSNERVILHASLVGAVLLVR